MAGRTVAAAALLTALVAATPEASRQAERRYTVRGMVLRIDAPSRTFFVSHERIEGLMDAMTMPFEVRDARQMQGVVPGALVDFVLVITKDAGYATNLRVRHYESAEQDPLTARRLALPRGAAGRVPAAGRHWPAGPGLHADRLDRAARDAVELRRQSRGDELRLHALRPAAVLPAHDEHLQRRCRSVSAACWAATRSC